eukprot:9072662-Ditylum_brightwellii.AAC.1
MPRTCILYQQCGGNPNYLTAKNCYGHKMISEKCKHPTNNSITVKDLYTSNLKLSKKPNKYKKKGKQK